jgi:hypothetical protein
MIPFRCATALVLFAIGSAIVSSAQTAKTFPTDDEINLVLTQTDRAIQRYKLLIDDAEGQLGKSSAAAIANDRQVVKLVEMAVKSFKAKPQGFNGPLGFAFFQWLDDADRNAVLCGNGASMQATLQMIAGNKDKADSLIHLAQGCVDASTLIYTVSENAGSLYQRYVEAEQQLAVQSGDAVKQCVDILKRNGALPKK